MKKVLLASLAVLFLLGNISVFADGCCGTCGGSKGGGSAMGDMEDEGIMMGEEMEDMDASMGMEGMSPGPAPNSGDGIPDGSGFDAPHSPKE